MSGTAVAVTSIEVRECFGGNDVAGLAAQTCSRQTAVPSRRSGLVTEKTPAVSCGFFFVWSKMGQNDIEFDEGAHLRGS